MKVKEKIGIVFFILAISSFYLTSFINAPGLDIDEDDKGLLLLTILGIIFSYISAISIYDKALKEKRALYIAIFAMDVY